MIVHLTMRTLFALELYSADVQPTVRSQALSNYVTIEGSNPIYLAHEISHAVGLWHVAEADNLANTACGGRTIRKWQRLIIRSSRFVTYV